MGFVAAVTWCSSWGGVAWFSTVGDTSGGHLPRGEAGRMPTAVDPGADQPTARAGPDLASHSVPPSADHPGLQWPARGPWHPRWWRIALA
jgi:hypothetical protein